MFSVYIVLYRVKIGNNYYYSCIIIIIILYIAGTLGFYLNGVAYPNGSAVLREDIGESGAALQCTTDSTICCNVDYLIEGSFYFPYSVHGSVYAIVVPRNQYYAEDGYYQRQYFQHIRLHREPTGNITGEFRCDIWDANFTHVNLYINISEYMCMYTSYDVHAQVYIILWDLSQL